MLKILAWVILVLGSFELAGAARAEVIQLKDQASVTGRILLEKQEQVFVDVGYTVLQIPRSQIVDIARTNSAEAAMTKPEAKSKRGLYSVLTTPPPERSVREMAAMVGESVVQVRTPGGLGSGFFINEEGYLITNFHVIEGETQISIEFYPKKTGQMERKNFKKVKIIAMNKFADLALLKVEDKEDTVIPFVPLAGDDSMSVGDRVFAIGSPLGLERTVTEGIVSTKTRVIQGTLYLQTTAQINPGNSGGPLFNLHGEVIGVTNMKITFGEGLGFAIPADAVTYFLDHRDAFAYDNENPNNAYRYLPPPSRVQN